MGFPSWKRANMVSDIFSRGPLCLVSARALSSFCRLRIDSARFRISHVLQTFPADPEYAQEGLLTDFLFLHVRIRQTIAVVDALLASFGSFAGALEIHKLGQMLRLSKSIIASLWQVYPYLIKSFPNSVSLKSSCTGISRKYAPRGEFSVFLSNNTPRGVFLQ